MLIKEMMSFVSYFNSKRGIRYYHPEEVRLQFEIKLKESGLHNPLLYYCQKAGATFLKHAVKRSLYMPNNDMKLENIIIKKPICYIITELPYETRMQNASWIVRSNYSPFITYLFLNDKLEDYCKRYLERSNGNHSIPYDDKKYYAEFMALQDTRSGEVT